MVAERESPALLHHLRSRRPRLVASDLMRVEALRVARRRSPEVEQRARSLLDVVTLVTVSRQVCDRASELDPRVLRSLDAVHLATALSLGDDLELVLTYDARMREACGWLGLDVVAPG